MLDLVHRPELGLVAASPSSPMLMRGAVIGHKCVMSMSLIFSIHRKKTLTYLLKFTLLRVTFPRLDGTLDHGHGSQKSWHLHTVP